MTSRAAWFHIRICFLLVGAVCGNQIARGGTANSLMDISSDGKLLACANRDAGSVSFVDIARREKLGEVHVGKKPEGISFLGKSRMLVVAVYGESRVVFIDAEARKLTESVDVLAEPYGVVADPDGATIYVTLEYPGEV